MVVGGYSSTNARTNAPSPLPSNAKVLGSTAVIFSMRLAYENCASTRNSPRSMPSRSGVRDRSPSLPKMAAPLVICSMRLTCRSNKGFAMGLPCSGSGYARANARNIGEDFIAGVEPIIAFEDDDGRRLPRKRIFEQIQGRVWHRVTMRIGKERLGEKLITDCDTARHLQLRQQSRLQP